MPDYVIVGGGTAGCVLANRLTENPNTTVLLLEAGGSDTDPALRVPTHWFNLLKTEVDWAYYTTPQPRLHNRKVLWSRGKVLGGSSTINAMLYVRGHRWDYDHWAALGCTGWSYNDVLPYFKKLEDNVRGDTDYHGTGGPIQVDDFDYIQEISPIFIKAGKELGLPFTDDFNGAQQHGVGWYQANHRDGERSSTVDGYLRPVLNRPNLQVETHALATRVLFDGSRATGVTYLHGDTEKTAHANAEVILCGGTINSPQLLMLSGVGDGDHLRELGIPVVVDSPSVGANLQDHPKFDMHFTSTPRIRKDFSLSGAEYDAYLQTKRGRLSVIRSQVGAFIKTDPALDLPNVQLYAANAGAEQNCDFALVASLLRPADRGTIRLQSPDPRDHPLIDPDYLSSDDDLHALVKSFKFLRRILQTEAFNGFYETEVNPGADVQTGAQIVAWLRDVLETTWHPTSTCAMGVDEAAVVDPALRVRGVDALRVVDASIMPTVVGGNTHVPTLMIAEKAADLIPSP